jgi:uncharacterized protein (TIGR02453 family)
MAFSGFPSRGREFLRDIAKNNNKEWFEAHKADYENYVREPMRMLVEDVNSKLKRFAPEYVADPKKISRIYRDTRFSKDKSPYRTDITIVFPKLGKEKHEVAGYFLSVSASKIEVLGGAYMPGPAELSRLRQAVAKDPKAARKIVSARDLVEGMGSLQGEQLQRVPKDFDPEHGAADLLRHKQFYYSTELSARLLESPSLVNEVVERFKLMKNFVQWLDGAMEP